MPLDTRKRHRKGYQSPSPQNLSPSVWASPQQHNPLDFIPSILRGFSSPVTQAVGWAGRHCEAAKHDDRAFIRPRPSTRDGEGTLLWKQWSIEGNWLSGHGIEIWEISLLRVVVCMSARQASGEDEGIKPCYCWGERFGFRATEDVEGGILWLRSGLWDWFVLICLTVVRFGMRLFGHTIVACYYWLSLFEFVCKIALNPIECDRRQFWVYQQLSTQYVVPVGKFRQRTMLLQT